MQQYQAIRRQIDEKLIEVRELERKLEDAPASDLHTLHSKLALAFESINRCSADLASAHTDEAKKHTPLPRG